MITFILENVQTIPYRIILTYSCLFFFVSEIRMLTRTIFDAHMTTDQTSDGLRRKKYSE